MHIYRAAVLERSRDGVVEKKNEKTNCAHQSTQGGPAMCSNARPKSQRSPGWQMSGMASSTASWLVHILTRPSQDMHVMFGITTFMTVGCMELVMSAARCRAGLGSSCNSFCACSLILTAKRHSGRMRSLLTWTPTSHAYCASVMPMAPIAIARRRHHAPHAPDGRTL